MKCSREESLKASKEMFDYMRDQLGATVGQMRLGGGAGSGKD